MLASLEATARGLELGFSADRTRAAGAFVLLVGLIAAAGGGAGLALDVGVRVGMVIACLVALVAVPAGLYLVAFAPRIAARRSVTFDTARGVVTGGGRTVLFRAIARVTVSVGAQAHALELVLKDGSSWRLHAESAMNAGACAELAQMAETIRSKTGLPR